MKHQPIDSMFSDADIEKEIKYLIYNSYGLVLVAHQAFDTTRKAIEDETDILSNITHLEANPRRKTVADTDSGKILRRQITDLEMLLAAYRKGLIKEIR